jgi:hypothetical protein
MTNHATFSLKMDAMVPVRRAVAVDVACRSAARLNSSLNDNDNDGADDDDDAEEEEEEDDAVDDRSDAIEGPSSGHSGISDIVDAILLLRSVVD